MNEQLFFMLIVWCFSLQTLLIMLTAYTYALSKDIKKLKEKINS